MISANPDSSLILLPDLEVRASMDDMIPMPDPRAKTSILARFGMMWIDGGVSPALMVAHQSVSEKGDTTTYLLIYFDREANGQWSLAMSFPGSEAKMTPYLKTNPRTMDVLKSVAVGRKQTV